MFFVAKCKDSVIKGLIPKFPTQQLKITIPKTIDLERRGTLLSVPDNECVNPSPASASHAKLTSNKKKIHSLKPVSGLYLFEHYIYRNIKISHSDEANYGSNYSARASPMKQTVILRNSEKIEKKEHFALEKRGNTYTDIASIAARKHKSSASALLSPDRKQNAHKIIWGTPSPKKNMVKSSSCAQKGDKQDSFLGKPDPLPLSTFYSTRDVDLNTLPPIKIAKKQFKRMQAVIADRKDPTVKRGLSQKPILSNNNAQKKK